MEQQNLITIDIFLLMGILGFIAQAVIIGYSIRLMGVMWGFTKWRNAWLVWTIAQVIITLRRLYTLHLIMQECNEAIVQAQYTSWLVDSGMLITLSVLYLIFMRLMFKIFSNTFHDIHEGP